MSISNTLKTALLAVLLPAASFAGAGERIVTLGGPITEIVFALGAGDAVIAVDQTSLYPERATKLPKVGNVRAISAEGVLSLNPTRIVSSSSLSPKVSVDQLKAGGIPLALFDNPTSVKTLFETITRLGNELGREKDAAALNKKLAGEMKLVDERIAKRKRAPRVAFLMGHGGSPMAAGDGTQGAGIVAMAGGENVFSGYRGYKPVSQEALLKAAPDFILIATLRSVKDEADSLPDSKAILKKFGFTNLLSLAGTRVVAVDTGEFLIFGPRTGDAALKLAKIFDGEGEKTPGQ